MSIRKTVVSGRFYPDNKDEVLRYFQSFQEQEKVEKKLEDIKALIVPHAGYVFSGYTAFLAYDLSKTVEQKRVIVIGPSHRVRFKGASVALYENYETPLGNIEIDKDFSQNLIEKHNYLNFYEETFFEHSTETQAPFVKEYFPNSKIVEIVYGEIDYIVLSALIDELLEDENNFIIISTDLSHFYTQEDANIIDKYCVEGIKNRNIDTFNKGEACGGVGVQAMLKSSINKGLETQVLYYCTSADAYGDKSRVVGYTSALIGK